jgi:hypothetical protein
MAYLDAATERIEETVTSRFEAAVESVRAGGIFARDGKQYQRWRGRTRRRSSSGSSGRGGGGLTGASLEAAVMGFAARFPQYVVRGDA